MNQVQMMELNVLNEVIKILDEHNLRWFAIGGTCIGAIRHNGFIPWDDDIDIGMPREDYEKFRTLYYKELPEYLLKMDADTAEEYPWLFMKVHDKRTTYIADYAEGKPDIYTGVFIDIMAMDGLPQDYEHSKHTKKLAALSKLNTIRRSDKINSRHGFIKNLFRNAVRIIFPYNYFSERFRKEARKVSFDNAPYTGYTFFITANIDKKRIYFPRVLFSNVIIKNFENIEINVPAGYDDALRIYFGDYMKLPPEESRNSGHPIVLEDLNRSFNDYK